MRFGMGGHAGVKGGQIVLNEELPVLDRAGTGQKKFSRSVHTQEVTGSSPAASTTKTPAIARFSVFLFVFRNFLARLKLVKNG